jgi:hypothetical protein
MFQRLFTILGCGFNLLDFNQKFGKHSISDLAMVGGMVQT